MLSVGLDGPLGWLHVSACSSSFCPLQKPKQEAESEPEPEPESEVRGGVQAAALPWTALLLCCANARPAIQVHQSAYPALPLQPEEEGSEEEEEGSDFEAEIAPKKAAGGSAAKRGRRAAAAAVSMERGGGGGPIGVWQAGGVWHGPSRLVGWMASSCMSSLPPGWLPQDEQEQAAAEGALWPPAVDPCACPECPDGAHCQ